MANEWTYGSEVDLTNGGADDLLIVEIIDGLCAEEIEVFVSQVSTTIADEAFILQVGDTDIILTQEVYEGNATSGTTPSGNETNGVKTAYNLHVDAASLVTGTFRFSRWDTEQHLWLVEWRGQEEGIGASFQGICVIKLDTELTSLHMTMEDTSARFDGGTAIVRYRATGKTEQTYSGFYTYTSQFDLTNDGADDLTAAVFASSLPAGIESIELMIRGYELDADNTPAMIQLGDAGGIETTGYENMYTASGSHQKDTDGFYLSLDSLQDIGRTTYCTAELTRFTAAGHKWLCNVWLYGKGGTICQHGFGIKTLSGELTQMQLTTPAGTAAFTHGDARIRYF